MKHLNLNPLLYEYLCKVSLHEHPVLQDLREETSKLELALMQVAPEQAQFMQFLLKIIGAKRVLELGTFTGYSALAMSLVLPEDGQLITCDVSTTWTDIAKPYWKKAGQDRKIELRIGPAKESLHSLINDGHRDYFDFIFIDADKSNYMDYYELGLKLLHPKGIMAIDNVLWGGKVLDEHISDAQTREIRKLNTTIHEDPRVFSSLIPISDGLFLVQKL